MQTLTEREKALLQKIIEDKENHMSPYACRNTNAVREHASKYDNDVLRTQFAIDVDSILHSALYNRGNDKTQVFSFYRNDDITRRSAHVQLVSRIARTIGHALRLNLDLIESIAIGHDVGHTPFGHKGEEFLSKLYHAHTGKYFNHNVHSVRVLQKITNCNLTLQTLDGILCHCGEKAFEVYTPNHVRTFEEYNKMLNDCYTKTGYIKSLRPSTLEGCVVRISDIIAYLGKDRQDALKAKLKIQYQPNRLGENNSEFITTIVTDIIKNSLEKPYLSISKDVFNCMTEALQENNDKIYQCDEVTKPYYEAIQPMMELMYTRFLDELKANDYNSLLYQHYLNGTLIGSFYRHPTKRFIQTDIHDPNDIVVDFIASMTDDYFIDAFAYLFPNNALREKIQYVEYFDKRFIK